MTARERVERERMQWLAVLAACEARDDAIAVPEDFHEGPITRAARETFRHVNTIALRGGHWRGAWVPPAR